MRFTRNVSILGLAFLCIALLRLYDSWGPR